MWRVQSACALARVWAGVRPSAGVWGWRESPKAIAKRLNCVSGSAANFFLDGLRFATGAHLRFGFWVVGVVEQLAARAAMCPVNPGVTAAGIPVDAALGREGVVALAGGFLASPPAA